ncbi:16S rRNA (uracil(1498)-N(3))-methyltransferase [Candidatus Parcubacteria bacterium]|nr:16S rRNA (uracil(1498)-N(3))-methyltransferase [Candidatus Parcubacteria bacterium]
MRLHRFFIEEQLRNKREITIFDEEVIHQWKDVFRLRTGNQLILLDNSGFEYIAEVVLLAKGKAELKIIDSSANTNDPKREVWLFASLIKKDNFEWILEKGTELGVSHFVPMLSERSEKKNLNIERAEKIIKEASEQSGRGIMPELHEVTDLGDLMTAEIREKLGIEVLPMIAFDPQGEKFDLARHLEARLPSSLQRQSPSTMLGATNPPVGVLVGPEGGWTPKELELFKLHNIPIYNLGPQILRAETAAIAISSLLLL